MLLRPDFEPVGAMVPDDLDGPRLLVGTRKGAWILASDRTRTRWVITPPMFLGRFLAADQRVRSGGDDGR